MNLFYRMRNSVSMSIAAFLLLSLLSTQTSTAKEISYPDFDKSMLREGVIFNEKKKIFAKRKKRYNSADRNFVAMFRDNYNRNIEAAKNDPEDSDYRIPPIVHQIWLGSQVPEKYYEWMASWMKIIGWEYRLWTDDDVKHLKLYNQELYDQSTNYGEKADILRLEILHRFGGIYVDTDYECFRPEILDELHKSYDFYIGFEPVEHGFVKKFNMFKVCNAVMASAPHHPLMKDFIENLKANYYAYRECCGPVERTGPSYLTRIICEYEKSHAHHHRNMYLPCTFIYLYSEPDITYFINNPEVPVELFPETLGIHYWSGSWKKKGLNFM